MLTGGSLFSGIEGFGLGLLWSGLINEIKWQVEIDDYCNKLLEKHFPETKRFRDIRDCGKHNLEPVDVIFGGDPCQPYSVAGKRKGKEDDRYLWPEMARIIKELKPAIVINENVPGSGELVLDQKITDLENFGYTTTTISIPACAVEAPHIRQRIWILAYSDTEWKQQPQRSEQEFGRRACNSSQDVSDADKLDDNRGGHGTSAVCRKRGKEAELSGSENVSHSQKPGLEGKDTTWDSCSRGQPVQSGRRGREYNRWIPEPGLGRVAHGIPCRVDRIKALGNAVVPQVAQAIGEIIKEWLKLNRR